MYASDTFAHSSHGVLILCFDSRMTASHSTSHTSIPSRTSTAQTASAHSDNCVALSRYKHITELSPFKLGLLITAHSLEVHLLRQAKDGPEILDQIELTGRSVKDRRIEFAGHTISITKPDRGTLVFRVEGALFAVNYSSRTKPGGTNVCILSSKLEANGQRQLGARNQQLISIFVPRLPSPEHEIAQLSSAVAANTHRLAGLSDRLSIGEFCKEMGSVFDKWESLQPRERRLLVRTTANELLMLSGVYPCYFPDEQTERANILYANKPCRFIPTQWSLYTAPAFIEKDILTGRDESHFAASLYAELRHVEQMWLVLRYLGGKTDTGALDKTYLPRELEAVIEAAEDLPIVPTRLESAHYDRLLDSITSETTNRAIQSFLGIHYRHPPELSCEDRLRQRLGLPYLFHQRDAAEIARTIRREWRRQRS